MKKQNIKPNEDFVNPPFMQVLNQCQNFFDVFRTATDHFKEKDEIKQNTKGYLIISYFGNHKLKIEIRKLWKDANAVSKTKNSSLIIPIGCLKSKCSAEELSLMTGFVPFGHIFYSSQGQKKCQ